MALDHCFQLMSSPPPTAAAFKPNAGVAFASRGKRSTTTCKAANASSTLSFSSSSSLGLRANRCRKTSFICKAKEAVDEVEAVTDSTWDSLVLGSGVPVLVDFWAPWCGPCRMIAPVIDDLAKEFAGKIACFKCNTDECPNIATKYGIRSIPTVLFFKNGERKESVIGAVPKQTLVSTIEKYLEV